jgi:hypothetical protein
MVVEIIVINYGKEAREPSPRFLQLKSLFSLTFGQEFVIFKTVFEKSVVKESNSIGEMRRVLADF